MTESTNAESCPDENVLVQFAGGMAGARLATIEAHLDGCEACRRSVAALERLARPEAPAQRGRRLARIRRLGAVHRPAVC